MSYQQDFTNKMLPYAQKAAAATGRDAGVILAQWSIESNWGRDHKATRMNNYGGIRFVGQKGATEYKSPTNGSFAVYPSIDVFVNDFIRIFNLNSYGYPAVRAATTPEAEVKALAASKYDAGGYGGGGAIMANYKTYFSNIGSVTPGKIPAGHCLCKQCGYLCQKGKTPAS